MVNFYVLVVFDCFSATLVFVLLDSLELQTRVGESRNNSEKKITSRIDKLSIFSYRLHLLVDEIIIVQVAACELINDIHELFISVSIVLY